MDLIKNLANKKDFYAAPFRLISASVTQLSGDIPNNITVKQNIFEVVSFSSSSEFQKIPLKEATAETTWDTPVLTSSIPFNSSLINYIYIYVHIHTYIYIYNYSIIIIII